MRYFDNELTIKDNAIDTILNHIALTMFSADDEEITAEEFAKRWINDKPLWDDFKTIRFVFLMDDDLKDCKGVYYLVERNKVSYIPFKLNPNDVYINSLAKRMYDTLDVSERYDTSVEDQKEILENDPLSAIAYLLDLVDTLNDMMC